MATYGYSSPAEQAAAYERYISENWDSLAPFEQEQARSWLQAKALAAMQPGYGANPYPGQNGYGYDGSAGGYLADPFDGLRPRQKEQPGDHYWAVPVGYVGLFVFMPLAFACGLVNLFNGRTGHGIVQLALPTILMTVIALYATSLQMMLFW